MLPASGRFWPSSGGSYDMFTESWWCVYQTLWTVNHLVRPYDKLLSRGYPMRKLMGVWRDKSPATLFLFDSLFWLTRVHIKAPLCWPFVTGNHWTHVDSPDKGPVTRKRRFHIMTSLCITFFLCVYNGRHEETIPNITKKSAVAWSSDTFRT